MAFLYAGWVLLLPLLFFWRQKVKWEMEALRLKTVLFEKEKAHDEKVALLNETREKLSDAFKVISWEALESFHVKSEKEMEKKEERLSKMLEPLKEGLGKLDVGMRFMEKERKGESEALKEQIRLVLESEKSLRDETANLVKSLRKPDVRGIWGEVQLKRVVEISGMLNHCDFLEQPVEVSEEGRLRPDLLVRLPGDRYVIIDAKAPFESFLEANQTENIDIREGKLKDHARRLRQHMQSLGKKAYWQQFERTPEFVVLFLPTEVFFSAALQYDPTLIEVGAALGVIIATPTTLIGLLRSIAFGWKQDTFSKHAEQISALGHELYKRLHDMNRHLASMGKSLTGAVDEYNKAIGSFERRVLVSARKFNEFGAANKEIEIDPIDLVEKIPRQVPDSTIEV